MLVGIENVHEWRATILSLKILLLLLHRMEFVVHTIEITNQSVPTYKSSPATQTLSFQNINIYISRNIQHYTYIHVTHEYAYYVSTSTVCTSTCKEKFENLYKTIFNYFHYFSILSRVNTLLIATSLAREKPTLVVC